MSGRDMYDRGGAIPVVVGDGMPGDATDTLGFISEDDVSVLLGLPRPQAVTPLPHLCLSDAQMILREALDSLYQQGEGEAEYD
ncbi:hypothetical protein KIPB_003852 [Kipferlia bialata]|uniref:Uncharacterized protein n=1 Tax=Kipferlia bialata TaxID=797122 RepID=A0A9K3CV34_9EUKA|nr:hypothetical protein KIPB_003852 [Kipferlia bialata]|eukprot:g3852.t1